MAKSVDDLSQDPAFAAALAQWALSCRSMFDGSPRLAHTMATHQRWIIAQAAYALFMEGRLSGGEGLTFTRLKDMVLPLKVVSRNTVLAFAEELLRYRHIVEITAPGRQRPRRFAAADVSSYLLFSWYAANLVSLDLLDGGNRTRLLSDRPELFCLAQPRMARNCLVDDRWCRPPENVAHFLWTVSGGLIVDDFMARIGGAQPADGRYDLGEVEPEALAEAFMMSVTHMRRILRKAIQSGLIGWQGPPNRSPMWLSETFVEEYKGWQAVKFHYVDEAFEWALAQPEVSIAARETILRALQGIEDLAAVKMAR